MFPNPSQLKQIEFWGGEPSYGLPRVIPTIEKAINHYPNLDKFLMSTNLTTDIGLKCLLDFFRFLKNFPNRKFNFHLQLSLDGPAWINDINRGKGTTVLFSKHFSELLFEIDNVLEEVENLTVEAFFKPTLDASSIAQLQTKEKVIEYFSFFEKYKKASDEYVKNPRWFFGIPNPNTATPSPHTIQDGKNFANFLKICKQIVINENKGSEYLKYPRNITPFVREGTGPSCQYASFYNGCLTCGSGSIILGLLPNNYVSACHSGFVDLLEEYKKKCMDQKDSVDRTIDPHLFLNQGINSTTIYKVEDYKKYEEQMASFCPESRFQLAELSSLIQLYAYAGQIDKKYLDNNEAIIGARFIQEHTASCVRDNMGVTGTKFLFQVGYIKLFLNGAKEEIEDVEQFLVSN